MSGAESDRVQAELLSHWAPSDLRQRVAALVDRVSRPVSIKDLAAFDQFHVLCVAVTRRLASKAGNTADQHVLDLGCGLGGTSRLLAKEFGCSATGVDFAAPFVETAEYLSDVTGLTSKVTFGVGDATDLQVGPDLFDVVWVQHVCQSIPDKAGVFSEIARVLKRGRTLVVHDLYKARRDIACTYPAVWDRDGSITFLATTAELRSALRRCGFRIESWTNSTSESLEWVRAGLAVRPDGPNQGSAAAIPGLDRAMLYTDAERSAVLTNAEKDISAGAIGFVELVARSDQRDEWRAV